MSLDPAYLSIGVTAAVLAAMASNRVPQDLAMVAGMLFLMLTGVLGAGEALAGFGNTGVITVGVLYVVVAGLRETGAMEWIAQRFLGSPRSTREAVFRLNGPTAVLSAFINNTPVVAMFIPVAQAWSARYRIAASKLMMPISFTAVLAGTCTLIGTSTNLVVDGLMQSKLGHQGMGLFEIAPVGLAVTAFGLAYIVLFSDKLLPDRASAVAQLADARQYAFEMMVQNGGPLVGKTIGEVGLRSMANAYVVELKRGTRLIAAVGPEEVLEAEDVLVCVGIVDAVKDLRRIPGLTVAEQQAGKLDLDQGQRCLVELVVAPGAPFAGKTVRESRFRTEYEAAILSISRNGERLTGKVGDIVLEPGDTLLVEAGRDFAHRHRYDRAFLLVSALQDSTPPDFSRAPMALGILAALIVVSSFEWLSLLEAGMIAAGLLIATRCMTLEVARSSVDFEVLVIIAASFALGVALDKTGGARLIADGFMALAGRDPLLTLAVIYVCTLVFTELISNNAAAALMFPIAVATANELGVSYMPFVVGVMFSASLSFVTPIGYQTNLMVYGPGGYRFGDYVRFGVPLTLITTVVALATIPWVFPFTP